MSRPKCSVCGKELTEHRQFEGWRLCTTHAAAVHNFIEAMKTKPQGVCLLVKMDSLEQSVLLLRNIMEASSK